MLTGLSIRDVVLIDALDLEIEAGFTALTGETGAGKSILLDALGLALGERAERGLVRDGADRASASAVFEIGPAHPVLALLGELGLDLPEDGRLVLRRAVTRDGKSRAYVNDAPASVGALRQIAGLLLEVHGQHASVGLMDVSTHRALLDQHARAGAQVSAVAAAWRAREEAGAALEAARTRLARAGDERDYLVHVLAEIDRLALQPGEEAALDAERRFLMGSERVAGALKDAAAALDDGTAESRLSAAARALSRAGSLEGEGAAAVAAAMDAAASALERALGELSDAQSALVRAGHALDADPSRLDAVEERLFALRAAARKHGVGVDALLSVRERAQAALTQIDDGDAAVARAEAAFAAAHAAWHAAATTLSARRVASAAALDAAVAEELPPLKLDRAQFRTRVEPDPERGGRHGWDRVSFEIAPNPGAGFGPLAEIASGGELSRLSLALKVVLSADGGTLALVFDEVDQGIGGATADAVGKRLARLAGRAQVLCVTHSPQVAARAGHHWRIEKSVADGRTRTRVAPLDGRAREDEIARMLSGADVTGPARAAARALLDDG